MPPRQPRSTHFPYTTLFRSDMAAARAIQYARALAPDELRAVHFDLDPVRTQDLTEAWRRLGEVLGADGDRKSTRLNSSHGYTSYAVFCSKKKNKSKV